MNVETVVRMAQDAAYKVSKDKALRTIKRNHLRFVRIAELPPEQMRTKAHIFVVRAAVHEVLSTIFGLENASWGAG